MPDKAKGPEKVKVRVTLFPDRDIEVPPDELPALRAQRLLIEDQPPAAQAPAPESAARPASVKKEPQP
jgi:hypothetical protein